MRNLQGEAGESSDVVGKPAQLGAASSQRAKRGSRQLEERSHFQLKPCCFGVTPQSIQDPPFHFFSFPPLRTGSGLREVYLMFYVCDGWGQEQVVSVLWFCLPSSELGLAPHVRCCPWSGRGKGCPGRGVLCEATLSSGPSAHPELGTVALEN